MISVPDDAVAVVDEGNVEGVPSSAAAARSSCGMVERKDMVGGQGRGPAQGGETGVVTRDVRCVRSGGDVRCVRGTCDA